MKIFGKRNPSATRPAPVAPSSDPREQRIHETGLAWLAIARDHRLGVLNSKFYQDKLMEWSMKDHAFKVQLFRFVDAFPALTTPDMIHDHLIDYLTQPGVKPPPGMDLGLKAGGLAKGLMASTIAKQIKGMAGNFIAGTDAAGALPKLKKLWDDGIAFSVDLLGEACVSCEEADAYQAKYLDLIENLPASVASWKANARLESDHMGSIPRTNVSVKVSSLCARLDPIDTEGSIRDLMTRLAPILETARDRGVFINFDMEQAALKDLTLTAFEHACEKIDFEAGIAMQGYLRSGVADARRISAWAKRAKRCVTVRLVKGAYWDYETILAEQMSWPSKVWGAKWQTDACFEDMTAVYLDACPRKPGDAGVKLALGSHNVRSIAAAVEGLRERELPKAALEIQMLHGMADQLKAAAAEQGFRVREYVPVGEMIPGMAYLVRRLLENTSNESWLKAGFLDDASPEVLLAAPAPKPRATHAYSQSFTPGQPMASPSQNGHAVEGENAQGLPPIPDISFSDLHIVGPERHQMSPAVEGVGDGRPFFNEPPRDFSIEQVRRDFAQAISEVEVTKVANDRTPEQASAMIAAAHKAQASWRNFDPIVRSRVLIHAASIMRAQRDHLSAMLLLENGKPWREADADVCEAIDFCDYYARQAPRLFAPERIGRFIGELDQLWHQPRGVAAVISPWNFPLAICTGMTAAALVTGNAAIVKPAEQTPGIAKVMHDIFQDALRQEKAPADVLQFCPAPGETTGASIVRDPRIAIIAFTGSRAVGLDIIKAAGITDEDAGQTEVKRVICEMGGKNAIIVDASADLDEAVLGVRYSAFGYAGQKCSACSRCIVVDPKGPDGPHATTFIRRLTESVGALVVGDPISPGTDVPPVIDAEAYGKIQDFIRRAEAEVGPAAIALPDVDLAPSPTGPRRCVGPRVFTGVRSEHELARDEVFGPVLAVMHAKDFSEALALANNHRYKLTGGVYTRKPEHIDRAKAEFRVGNLYVNRPCTGALVARMPFGGFGMSGVGSKAGGSEYLYQFVEPRAYSENTMRRGFAPEL